MSHPDSPATAKPQSGENAQKQSGQEQSGQEQSGKGGRLKGAMQNKIFRNKRQAKDNRVGLPPRRAAVQLLQSVLQDKKPLDNALGRYGQRGPMQHLAQRDRALARAITATSLRRLGQINALLDSFLEKPLPKKCGSLREILISGMAQILFMDAPDHAAIDLAVCLCQLDKRCRHLDKLANAILRRTTREGHELIAGQDALRLNTPDWLWQRWSSAYGEEITRQIVSAHMSEAMLDLSVKSDPAAWAEKLNALLLPNGSLRLNHKGMIERLEGYDQGAWWVQDVAASIPALLMGDIAGKRVADLCAAPGGKTAQLAAMGAQVTAVDNNAIRVDRLKENIQRLRLDIEVIEADVEKWFVRDLFDAILLDAPCSATGTIRRHPDLPYLKQESDIAELIDIQRRLLKKAVSLLKPGGHLVYCTCSLEEEEGYDQIKWLMREDPKLTLSPIGIQESRGQAQWMASGVVRTLPFHGVGAGQDVVGLDGFFAARIIKNP